MITKTAYKLFNLLNKLHLLEPQKKLYDDYNVFYHGTDSALAKKILGGEGIKPAGSVDSPHAAYYAASNDRLKQYGKTYFAPGLSTASEYANQATVDNLVGSPIKIISNLVSGIRNKISGKEFNTNHKPTILELFVPKKQAIEPDPEYMRTTKWGHAHTEDTVPAWRTEGGIPSSQIRGGKGFVEPEESKAFYRDTDGTVRVKNTLSGLLQRVHNNSYDYQHPFGRLTDFLKSQSLDIKPGDDIFTIARKYEDIYNDNFIIPPAKSTERLASNLNGSPTHLVKDMLPKSISDEAVRQQIIEMSANPNISKEDLANFISKYYNNIFDDAIIADYKDMLKDLYSK